MQEKQEETPIALPNDIVFMDGSKKTKITKSFKAKEAVVSHDPPRPVGTQHI